MKMVKMMTIERPILFSTAMVQAILKGSKTQTRRIVKGAEKFPAIFKFEPWVVDDEQQFRVSGIPLWVGRDPGCFLEWGCPYGKTGDRLWVRETWRHAMSDTHECFHYKADNKYQCGNSAPTDYKPDWKPTIHMPKKACRLFLEIRNISVERLQEISVGDAIAEGVEGKNSITGFKTLWESINGANSWDTNPWVWVIEFSKL